MSKGSNGEEKINICCPFVHACCFEARNVKSLPTAELAKKTKFYYDYISKYIQEIIHTADGVVLNVTTC